MTSSVSPADTVRTQCAGSLRTKRQHGHAPAEELRKHRLLRGAVVAVREGEEYRVVYPVGFKGEFSLL